MEGPTGLRVAVIGMRADLPLRRDALELACAIQRDAEEVTFRRIIRRSNEVQVAAFFIDARNTDDVVIARREETGVSTGRIHGIEVTPAIALAQPKETRPAVDPSHVFHDFYPRIITIREEDFRGAGDRVARDDVVSILESVELLKKDAAGIWRPLHARDVMIAWIGVGVKPTRRATRGIDDADLAGGVLLSDLGIGEGRDLRIKAVSIVDQREFTYARGIKLPIGDIPAVRAPPQAITQAEFFFVHPVGGAINGVRAAISGQRGDAEISQRLDVDVVLVNVRDVTSVWRQRGEEERGSGGRTAQLTEGSSLAV